MVESVRALPTSESKVMWHQVNDLVEKVELKLDGIVALQRRVDELVASARPAPSPVNVACEAGPPLQGDAGGDALPQADGGFEMGELVLVKGLASASQYNGMMGAVAKGVPASAPRVPIVLTCGKELSVRPANLVRCPSCAASKSNSTSFSRCSSLDFSRGRAGLA